MKDLNRRKFEEDWKQAFQDGEVDPSNSVWANIELDLVSGESESMKKQVLFYKWLAAASVLILVFIGGTFFYNSKTGENQLADSHDKSSPKASTSLELKGEKQLKEVNKNEVTKEKKVIASNDIPIAITQKNTSNNSNVHNIALSVINTEMFAKDSVSSVEMMPLTTINRSFKPEAVTVSLLSSIKEPSLKLHGNIVLPRLVLPAMPSVFMATAKKNKSNELTWASVGFSAGSYNPGNSSGSSALSASLSTKNSYVSSNGFSSSSNVGSAYSAGFAMSKRVLTRWVVQSGVNYMNQTIGYSSNLVAYSPSNQSKALVAEYADLSNASVTITNPYQINSAIEVVSVPLQTGYLLIDRKLGWQLNTGIAADFFVRNTLTDQSGNANRFSQGAGDKSPYRALSWAGLLGTEVSYKVAKQYRISIVPSMRYSVNSVLKSTSGQSNPVVMDIGLRFRYIFK